MKKIGNVLFFGVLGFVSILGIVALKKYLDNKSYANDYDDYHRHFTDIPKDDDGHGIEYLH